MEIKEIITFEKFLFLKKVFFFHQPAELFLSVCQLGGEKEHLLGYSYLHVIQMNLNYMETFLFSCCKNIILHIKRVVFQILWTILGIFK